MKPLRQGIGVLQGTWQCRTGLEETVCRTGRWVQGLTGARLRLQLGEADLLLPLVGNAMAPKDHANSCPAG